MNPLRVLLALVLLTFSLPVLAESGPERVPPPDFITPVPYVPPPTPTPVPIAPYVPLEPPKKLVDDRPVGAWFRTRRKEISPYPQCGYVCQPDYGDEAAWEVWSYNPTSQCPASNCSVSETGLCDPEYDSTVTGTCP